MFQGIVEGFVGCINNIKINDRVIEEDPVTNNTIPCSGLTEIGAYFYGDGGYISLGKPLKPVSHRTRLGTRLQYGILGYTRFDWYEY